ncbi:hypothetical protein DNFV4_00410 [Nitrospira tepida]|uniref:Uncharacterized protein n=1 Tax=Nitrospira tepida TaxID=2973512 RepID=A0AA86T1D9_9BACT|nr:hypothetical protein [Nitrospira tepida]CAI4029990.1 hypothetical protein DNFV4_00410 [Nitrospira tepida]
MAMWIRYLNALLGSLVLTTGLWIAVGELSPPAAVAVYGLIAGALGWLCSNNTAIWAWTTLLFGAESLAWPISMMVRIKLAGMDPTEQQMQDMLTAILFGLFSSIFWFTFAYGLFKRTRIPEGTAQASPQRVGDATSSAPPGRRRRSQKGRRA